MSAIVLDDTTPISFVGPWVRWTNQGYRSSVYECLKGDGSAYFQWFFDVDPGLYRVSATWFPYTNRATNSPYSVYDGTTPVGSKRLNQQLAPNDFTANGVGWQDVGTFPISSGPLAVRLSNDANGNLNADAIRVERVGDAPVPPPTPASQFAITLRLGSGITPSQAVVFQQAADRWGKVIVGDLPDAVWNGQVVDDVLIDAMAIAIDGPGQVLGRGGPDAFRLNGQPIHGSIIFDSADLAQLEAQGGLLYTAMHELAHAALGFGTSAKWQSFVGVTGNYFTGPNAVREYRAAGGSAANPGVPLETGGGSGTAGSHWSEAVFGSELMTGYLNPGLNPLSRVTIGCLQDLGYVCDLSAADPFPALVGAAPGVGYAGPRRRFH